MADRIEEAFARIRAEGRPGLITYTTAGDPDLPRSAEILMALDRAGADVIEVGVPFSDPLADGPVIQRATERALAAGGSLRASLAMIERLRHGLSAPVVLFTYANPIVHIGVGEFAKRAAAAGVDGVLVLDLPIEEATEFRETLAASRLDMVFLLSPTTTDARIRKAAELGRGFLYGISRLGVTGARDRVAEGAEAMIGRIRAHTSMPIALGFGISGPEQVAEVCRYADAAVVGSALVAFIAEASGAADMIQQVEDYVRWLKGTSARDPRGSAGPAQATSAEGRQESASASAAAPTSGGRPPRA
jgi:tryptophan synthase alpha chain